MASLVHPQLAGVLRDLIPVVSTRSDASKIADVQVPEVGIRWGKPAAFTFSAAERANDDGPDSQQHFSFHAQLDPDKPKKILFYSAGINMTKGIMIGVSNVIPPAGAVTIIVPGEVVYGYPTNVSFTFTETLPKRYIGQLGNPVRYWDFNLPFTLPQLPVPEDPID